MRRVRKTYYADCGLIFYINCSTIQLGKMGKCFQGTVILIPSLTLAFLYLSNGRANYFSEWTLRTGGLLWPWCSKVYVWLNLRSGLDVWCHHFYFVEILQIVLETSLFLSVEHYRTSKICFRAENKQKSLGTIGKHFDTVILST